MSKVKSPLIFIFLTVLIDSIGIRIILPSMPTIISEVKQVSIDTAAAYGGWMMSIYAVLQLVFSPILGGLSDRFGRRPVLLFSLVGTVTNYIILSSANTITFLFIGRIIGGICGASLTTSFAYMADISSPEKRAKDFGLVGTAVGLGFIIGPFLGGILSQFGTRVPFIAAAILSLINLIYGFCTIPESLKLENRREFDIKRANILGTFNHLKKRKTSRNYLLVLFLVYVAGQTLPATWPFFTKLKYQWSELQIGYSLAFVGLMIALVKGTLIKWSQEKFGSSRAIAIGLVFNLIGLALFSIASPSWAMYLFITIYCIGGIAPPLLQAIISSKVSSDEQGELQGIIISLISISNILSPLLMTTIFHYFAKSESNIYFPGAPFLMASFIAALGLIIFGNEKKWNN